ncbi:Copper outer membrane regulator [Legionella massiliensis]|uniref:Copper outer membrane regulator n=1 Tax=Legionella massiliensis TaxID=1034943 RepID=A0A078KS30_9GAMM|nr:TetR/AcrR family transcriptional regulator [Legionella massiliensis]CDZ77265.1 Copper outer membrane regulator [Legionella massiliensis]CEE13003.1 HTH-type transcriptional repressor ComR [Legionella massiliensis]
MARIREFDRTIVLRKAIEVFWTRGFDSTNLPELLEAMGLSKSSLYDTFGDKKKLFEEAIDLYVKEIAFSKVEMLVNASSVKAGFQAFFAEQIRCCTDQKFPGGCFLVNTAISLNNVPPPLEKKIRESVEKMHALFLSQIQKGQKAGEIPHEKDASAFASAIIGTSMGMNVMARVNIRDVRTLEQMVETTMNSIFK